MTNKNLTSGTNTFPTFNQNTTGSAATLTTTRTLWGQNFNGSANVTGSLTDVANITGGASSMIITAGTGNSRTIEFKTTTAGGVATTALTLNNLQNAIFAGEVSSTTSTTGTAFADKAVMTTIRSDNILTLTSAPLAVFDGRDKFTYGNGGLIVDTANQSVDVVHLRGIVVVPPIITEGAAAGVSPTISVTGSDLSGIIELTTGDGTTNNDVLFTLNFGAAFTTLPTVVIYPVNSNAGSLNDIYVKESTLNVAFAEIWANTLVPDRGSDYKWRYVIVEPS